MGCMSSRTSKSFSNLNSKLYEYEKSLGFRKCKPVYIEAIYSRLSNTQVDLAQNLTSFLKACNVSLPPDSEKILSTMIKDYDIRLLKLIALCGILLSNKPATYKAETIWYLYDHTMINRLTKPEFARLLKELILASYFFSTQIYMLRLTNQDQMQEMSNYHYSLHTKEESLYLKFLLSFMDKSDVITKESFIRKIEDEPSLNITSIIALRHELEHVREMPNKYADSFQNLKRTRLTV